MDKMTQLLKLLENTKSIEINEFRMDFDELELYLMPAIQQAVQKAVTTEKAIATEIMAMEEYKPPIQDYPWKGGRGSIRKRQ